MTPIKYHEAAEDEFLREKDSLLILAVAHHSRRPGYWVGRVRRADEERKGGT